MDIDMDTENTVNDELQMEEIKTTGVPKTLHELLSNVYENLVKTDGNLANALIYTLRKYKYWPALQVKKFFTNKNLVLLHNTYKREDVAHFQELYDECRSLVLDLSAPIGQRVVVTFTHNIPERLDDSQYEAIQSQSDICEVSYEGTVVTIYNYQDTWFFSTSSCPTIDSSRYFHPTKTHGNMLDEAIAKILNVNFPGSKEESINMRNTFCDQFLDKSCAYAFILIHHQNRHVVDYTDTFGENYAKLAHITTRARMTLIDEDITLKPFESRGIIYSHIFQTAQQALEYIRGIPNTYGIIVKRENNVRIKVSINSIVKREEYDLGNPNIWHNMIWVYIQNKAYKIVDYEKDFCKDLVFPKNSKDQELAPTYIIHTVICTMRDILYELYNQTTRYYSHTKSYKIDIPKDKLLAPIIRFHLAQLRNLQVLNHSHAPLMPRPIYHYICHHQTLKNLRLLINYFATSWFPAHVSEHKIPLKTIECFKILDELLSK
jgi:hypothetical protein